MSILLSKETKAMIQGITGKEGQKTAVAMLEYNTDVAGGVRPGKGGEEVHGKPVFNTVKEAVESIENINLSAVIVPPFAVKKAVLEAIENDIPQIYIFCERTPIKDTAYCLAAAKEKDIRIIGPSSMGYIAPGVGRVGLNG